MYVINRIDVTSAFKVGAVVTALIWVVVGVLLVFLPTMFVGMISINPMGGTSYMDSSGFSAISMSVLCVMYICGGIANAVMGGIMAALGAFLYNLVVRWTGGLKIELARESVTFEKFKNFSDDNPFDPIE